MIKVITAPEIQTFDKDYIKVFLAGGITKCPNWQKDVIFYLQLDVNLVGIDIALFNPRRESFNVNNLKDAYEQVAWEFNNLEQCDIFSMYFCKSDSVQPICLYELGRNIPIMQQRFPDSWQNRIVLSVESGYSRWFDVDYQTYLAVHRFQFSNQILANTMSTPREHAVMISSAIRQINKLKEKTNAYSIDKIL